MQVQLREPGRQTQIVGQKRGEKQEKGQAIRKQGRQGKGRIRKKRETGNKIKEPGNENTEQRLGIAQAAKHRNAILHPKQRHI